MPDERYIECAECGARDSGHVNVKMRVVPGDGSPWIDGVAEEVWEWTCEECNTISDDVREVFFVGYPGITQEERDAQVFG